MCFLPLCKTADKVTKQATYCCVAKAENIYVDCLCRSRKKNGIASNYRRSQSFDLCYLHRRYSCVGLITFVILLVKIMVHSCWSVCQIKKKRSVWRIRRTKGIISFQENTQFSHQCGLQKTHCIGRGGCLGHHLKTACNVRVASLSLQPCY